MSTKWMGLMLFIAGAIMVSGCSSHIGSISDEGMAAYNDAKATFQKAEQAGAKTCAPAEYGKAEANLVLADEEVAEADEDRHFQVVVKAAKDNSLEALKLCELAKAQVPVAPVAKAEPEPKKQPEQPRCSNVIPSTAKPGECYARILVPERYQTFTERVLTRQAEERIETIPASFETVEEAVLVRQASQRYEEVPAEYGWTEERVLVEPAHSEWKKGRGLIERVDNATGEILCLVDVPARYETVTKRVVTKPSSVRVIDIPAEYAKVKVTKMVSPPQEKRIPIPEEYGTITRREKVADSCFDWKKVLCETNMTPEVVSKLQEALVREGYNPGPIDGNYGRNTQAAVASYQKAKGLGEGELTYETLESLNVSVD